MSGKKIYNFKNPSKCLFTCIQWDYIHQVFIQSDCMIGISGQWWTRQHVFHISTFRQISLDFQPLQTEDIEVWNNGLGFIIGIEEQEEWRYSVFHYHSWKVDWHDKSEKGS